MSRQPDPEPEKSRPSAAASRTPEARPEQGAPEPSGALSAGRARAVRRAARGDLEAAILDEARRVLVEQGYTDLSMRKIAAAIGVTPTSIYLYFKNKDALLHALIDEGMSRLHGELAGALAGVLEPSERLHVLCRAYLQFGLAQPEFYEVMFMLHPQHMQRYPAEMYRRARRSLGLIASVLGELRGPLVSETQVALDANVVWSTLHGVLALLIARRLDTRVDPQAFLDAAVRRVSDSFQHYADPGQDVQGIAEAS